MTKEEAVLLALKENVNHPFLCSELIEKRSEEILRSVRESEKNAEAEMRAEM